MDFVIGNHYTVNAEKVLARGIVVRLADGSTEFIHISQLSDHFVSNIADEVEIGKKYEAVCIASQVKDYELSIRAAQKKELKPEQKSYDKDRYVPTRYTQNRYNNKKPQYTPKPVTPDLEAMIKRSQKDFESKRRKDHFDPKRRKHR